MKRVQSWRWMGAALLLAVGCAEVRAEEFVIQSLDKESARIVFGAVDGGFVHML